MARKRERRVFVGGEWATIVGLEPGLAITESDFGVGQSWPIDQVQVRKSAGSNQLVPYTTRYPSLKSD